MLKRSNSLVALLFLSSTLALIGVACSSNKSQQSKALPDPVNVSSAKQQLPKTQVQTTEVFGRNNSGNTDLSFQPQPSPYELALDKADGAISISQSAKSSYDWQLVATQWSDAITLMQTIPNNSPYKAIAKTKIPQYQRYLVHAQQQTNQPIHSPDNVAEFPDPTQFQEPAIDLEVPQSSVAPQDQSVFQAAIKRRIGGTPVIDVTFNNTSTVEMIVDTGASGTVLTQETANALGLIAVAKAKANTASAKAVEFPIGYVDSIQVGGASVKNVPVAIAPDSVLETGLLGHDFFGNYDVTIKRDLVEFRRR